MELTFWENTWMVQQNKRSRWTGQKEKAGRWSGRKKKTTISLSELVKSQRQEKVHLSSSIEIIAQRICSAHTCRPISPSIAPGPLAWQVALNSHSQSLPASSWFPAHQGHWVPPLAWGADSVRVSRWRPSSLHGGDG